MSAYEPSEFLISITLLDRLTDGVLLPSKENISLLDGYVVSGEEKLLKPDARLYRVLLDRYGLKAEECVFIDDNPANTAGAEAVGIKGIVFQGVEQLRKQLDTLL